MALLTRSTLVGPADTTHLMKVPQISGDVYAGEALDAGACVYRKASDGLVYMSNGTAVAEAARFMGVVVRTVPAGQPVTIYRSGTRLQYGTGLTIGALYYVAATAGRLDTAATTGGLVAVAEAISSTDIQILVNRAGA